MARRENGLLTRVDYTLLIMFSLLPLGKRTGVEPFVGWRFFIIHMLGGQPRYRIGLIHIEHGLLHTERNCS